jgi:glycosyltransferase involved in cell wall biosynthesis
MVNINNSKVIVTLHDTWFFTGGCHYTSTCELFFSSCNKCPKIRSPFHFLVKQNYVLKEKIASHPNVKFIAPSKWIFDLAKKSKVLRNKELILAPNISMHYIRAREIISTKTKPKSSIKKNLTIGFLANNINDPRKNLSFLFQAIRILPKNYSSLVSLSIGGKGRIRNNNFTEKLNINKFNYLYSSSEIDNFFDSIDILAVPSLEDNAPMVASEAAIRGIPVLARRGTGLDELIKDRVSGFLFSDTDDFLSIIVDLIYDKTVLAVMGNIFKLDFLNINDPKIILKIYNEVYK